MTIPLVNGKSSLVDSFCLHQSSSACPETKERRQLQDGQLPWDSGSRGKFLAHFIIPPSLGPTSQPVVRKQSAYWTSESLGVGRPASKSHSPKPKHNQASGRKAGPELPPRTTNNTIRYPPNLEGIFAPRNGPSPVPTAVKLFAWAVWGLIYGGVRLTCKSQCILIGVTH